VHLAGAIVTLVAAAACHRGDTADGGASSHCYTSPTSALGRVPNDAGGVPVGPGWVRLDGPRADSGSALLLDADGGSLAARWRRAGGDSLNVVGFDDFLRVELQVQRSDAGLRGTAHATSDAALERDSTGTMRAMDRRLEFTARLTTCDSMPRVRNA
jgi:hypothetical protein